MVEAINRSTRLVEELGSFKVLIKRERKSNKYNIKKEKSIYSLEVTYIRKRMHF